MIPEIMKNDVVQFTENHKWCGCLGIVEDVKIKDGDTQYLVNVPIPEKGQAYIRVNKSERAIEWIGSAILVYTTIEEGKW